MKLAAALLTVLLGVTAACSSQAGDPQQDSGKRPRVVGTVATGLAAPWGVTFLPDGSALVGERDTTRVVAVEDGQVRTVGRVDGVSPRGEAGLLGLAASPSYERDGLVYAYLSTAEDNRVVTMTYDGQRLGAPQPVLTGIPNGFVHDGGRLLFAPDGNLFVSTGETGDQRLAQDRDSLGGKVLRITPDGKAAPGNPVPGSPVWTMGHRNVQGLAFDGDGHLWATEFGQDTWDELNRIDEGRNYGWPLVEGRGDQASYRNPSVQWRTDEASPSGLAYLDGSLWAGALRGGRLWQVPVTADGTGRPRDWFVGDYGRLRTVVVAPDGNLWVTTSNRDGRGTPGPDDDRILVVDPG
jgi:glucose/arabinose dehydrogenase